MGIQRSFTVKCDKCDYHADNTYTNATNLRKACTEERWTISGNKFTCPVCNKNNPEYQRHLEMVAGHESH